MSLRQIQDSYFHSTYFSLPFFFYLLLSYKQFDFWGNFFSFKLCCFFFCDSIRDPIRDLIRDPVRDPIRNPVRDAIRDPVLSDPVLSTPRMLKYRSNP